MKCPLSLRDTVVVDGTECTTRAMECKPDCAWLLERGTDSDRVCAIAVLASSDTEPMGFCPVNVIERGA